MHCDLALHVLFRNREPDVLAIAPHSLHFAEVLVAVQQVTMDDAYSPGYHFVTPR
jgi:hypothetical protein